MTQHSSYCNQKRDGIYSGIRRTTCTQSYQKRGGPAKNASTYLANNLAELEVKFKKKHMAVSINAGTPSHHPFRTIGFSTVNHPFGGTPMTMETPMAVSGLRSQILTKARIVVG